MKVIFLEVYIIKELGLYLDLARNKVMESIFDWGQLVRKTWECLLALREDPLERESVII